MNILFATHDFGVNGATVALLDAVRHVIGLGHAVSLITSRNVHDNPSGMMDEFLKLGARVVKSADIKKCDLLIANPLFSPNVILGAHGHVPILGWIHEGWAGVQMARRKPEIAQALLKVNRLIFPTASAAGNFRSFLPGFPAEQISIIPYAIRAAELGDAQPCDVRPQPDGKIRIAFVGSFGGRKRPGDLARAVLNLRDPRVVCCFVGEVHQGDDEVERLVLDNPGIFTRTGAVSQSEVQQIYRSTDIFCLPSSDESFGIAALEAAAHKIPVVLSDLECYEGLWRHGRNCLIHPVGDVRLLNAYLKVLIDAPDMRARLGASGAKIARMYSHKRFNALFEMAMDDTLSA